MPGNSITSKAKRLRFAMTDVECRAWRHLRLRQRHDYQCRRQHPIDPYIADFARIECELAAEVDGSQFFACADEDERRTCYLNEHGFRVLRFWNNQMFNEMRAVLDVIAAAMMSPRPTPVLPPKREEENR